MKPEEPETLDLRSHDVAEERRQELLRLFPEVRTEGGKLDFERLKLALGETVDAGKERYGMTWPGKADCFRAIQSPSLGTLRPSREESVDFDSTENLIIEGDNLEVLKLLQKSYLGKVKLIYIDPPYNTGKDFIYPDNYSESLQTYLEYTGQVDAEGRKFRTNADTDGRFHSKWLNMMYPRLYVARNLLRQDGVMFVTIDDTEHDNLRKACSEIFGEENFVANVVWEKKYAKQNDATWLSTSHDHILVFARDKSVWRPNTLTRTQAQLRGYANPDNDPRGLWQSVVYTCNKTKEERPNLYYPIKHPTTGVEVWPSATRVWGYEKPTHERNVAEGRLWWGAKGDLEKPRLKVFLSEVGEGVVPDTLWLRSDVGDNQDAKRILVELLPAASFETPKPPSLIARMLALATAPQADDIVLDFFAGSGTTAQAVLEQNATDRGNRKFLLVQLPEPASRGEFSTLAEVTKERVRRVIQKMNDEDASKLALDGGAKPDRGFRVFKLAESNFTTWDAEQPKDAEALGKQLELHVEHLRDGRTQDDQLYEILLKSGYPLTTAVETIELAGKPVFSAAGGAFLLCLDRSLTLELIRAMADLRPERVVCLDAGFAGNDQLKANAVQIFKSKGVTKFLTV